MFMVSAVEDLEVEDAVAETSSVMVPMVNGLKV